MLIPTILKTQRRSSVRDASVSFYQLKVAYNPEAGSKKGAISMLKKYERVYHRKTCNRPAIWGSILSFSLGCHLHSNSSTRGPCSVARKSHLPESVKVAEVQKVLIFSLPYIPLKHGQLVSLEFVQAGRWDFSKNCPTEPIFVNILSGAKESIPSLAGRYDNPIWYTGPPSYIRLAEQIPWNRFLGSLNVNKFGLWGHYSGLSVCKL